MNKDNKLASEIQLLWAFSQIASLPTMNTSSESLLSDPKNINQTPPKEQFTQYPKQQHGRKPNLKGRGR